MTIEQRLKHYIETLSAIQNVLYHATSVLRLYDILDSDVLEAKTGHLITHTGGKKRSLNWAIRPKDITDNGYILGVSLTRNKLFAKKWVSRATSDNSGHVILVLNADLIKRDFRIIPVAFWGSNTNMRHEAEEFVIGAIKPLHKYLIHVETTQTTFDSDPLFHDLLGVIEHAPNIVIKGE